MQVNYQAELGKTVVKLVKLVGILRNEPHTIAKYYNTFLALSSYLTSDSRRTA